MRIAFIGAGGIGGYFGARLAAAGVDVHFVVRPGTLAALRARGLRIESAHTPLHLPTVSATSDPATIGPVDFVMFTPKLSDAEEASPLVLPLLGPRTLVIPFQNGVDGPAILMKVVPPAQVASGVAYISANIREPGVISHNGSFAKLHFGALAPVQQPALDRLQATFEQAGVEGSCPPDIRRAVWEKFVFLAALSGMTAVTRGPLGPIVADPLMRSVLRDIMVEVWSVARAEGTDLGPTHVDERMKMVDSLPPGTKASMLHDLEAGKKLEAPWLAGAVVRLGEKHGLATPVNRTILAALTPFCQGRAS